MAGLFFETLRYLHAAFTYFCDSTHFTRVLASASVTLLGGMGTCPHTPEPPARTFFDSVARAFLSLLYLAATSLYAGPTIFLSTEWQARQPLSWASLAASWAKTLPERARAAAAAAAK